MKYMILTFASQQDYQEMAGQPSGRPVWTQEEWAALGAAARVLSTSGRGLMRMCGRSTSTSRTSKAEREGRLPVIPAETEDLLRRLAPQVLGAVVRRYGNFDLAEDATQEAMAATAMQWPRDWLPENPRAWLITVASRRLTDLLRSEQARRRREDTVAGWALAERDAPRPDEPRAGDTDDTLVLLLLCCHPSLPAASQTLCCGSCT